MSDNVLNSYLVPVSTPTELAGMATNRFLNGQPAVVATMRPNAGAGVYYLQPAISNNPDNFFVVPTFDDQLRQWVYCSIQEQGLFGVYSVEVDLTVSPQTIVLIPPVTYRYAVLLPPAVYLTQKDGTIAVGVTMQTGTDTGASNINASGVVSAALALNTRANAGLAASVSDNNLDLTANGLRALITSPAVLGTATVYKARFTTVCQLSRF